MTRQAYDLTATLVDIAQSGMMPEPPAPQHYAPYPYQAAGEYAWLQGIHARLNAIVRELADGYPIISTPDHIEAAIRKGMDMADDVYRQMCAADGEGA